MQARGSTTRATSVAKVAGQRGVKVLVIPGEEGICGEVHLAVVPREVAVSDFEVLEFREVEEIASHWICSLIEERFEINDFTFAIGKHQSNFVIG